MMDESFLQTVLCTALQAALDAGDYFKSRFATELVVKTKTSLADVVTDVDPHCEQLIRTHIHARFPNHAVLGEEDVAPGRDAAITATKEIGDAEAVWIVDPLDGTTNFVSAIPLSVVSIAFAVHGQLQVGVIYDPYRAEVFYGAQGQGARLASRNEVADWLKQPGSPQPGVKLTVSAVADIDRAVLATGLPMRHRDRPVMMERTAKLLTAAKSLRALGAAALHLAYVAAGRIDAFWEYELNAWDVAAGVLLVQEASGSVAALDGSGYTLLTRDIVASGSQQIAKQIQMALR